MPAPVSLRLNDAPTYERFYGFVRSPFTPLPDPQFFYRSRSHGAALELLRDAVRRRQPFALVCGDTGTGKTTVCRVLEAVPDAASVAACILETPRSAEDLLRKALVAFGLVSPEAAGAGRAAHATREDLARTLAEFLQSLKPLDARCALILDDAHRMPQELMQQLAELTAPERGEPSLVTVVLAGDPGLAATLARPEMRALDERLAVRATLVALARDEIGPYITHRLASGGAPQPPRFERAAADAVHAHTSGVPREIDALCDRVLALAARLGVRAIGAQLVDDAARGTLVDRTAPSTPAPWWTRVPRWAWIVVPILAGLLVMAVWFSGAA